MEGYFSYGLTPYPLPLFKDGIMRSLDKAEFREKTLMKEAIPT